MAAASLAMLPVAAAILAAQTRSLAQDSTLDNLRHAPGYQTAAWNTLGAVSKAGRGSRAMILIPGLGFGADVFDTFVARQADDFTTYAVTLPGFAGTPALPMPSPDSASYAHTSWTRSAVRAILAVMDREGIQQATIVAHWILSSQIALRIALDHPERVDGVVLLAGVAKAYYDNDTTMLHWPAARRAAYADALGARWFRTVTRRTWDDNNFMTFDYARHPLRALFLWREAASPPLSVWVRYLLEFYAIDLTPDLARLRAPVLVVRPGFDDADFPIEPGLNYMRSLTHDSWRGVDTTTAPIAFATVPGARLFVMYDNPEDVAREIAPFLSRIRRP